MIIKKCKKKKNSPFVGSVLVDILNLAVVAIKQYKNSQKKTDMQTQKLKTFHIKTSNEVNPLSPKGDQHQISL